MNFYEEYEKYVIDPQTEIHYAILSNFKNTKFPHCHDFYELFLVIEGSLLLEINNTELLLKDGSLVLIRPKDVHSKQFIKSGSQINVAFPQKTVQELFNYLGDGFPKEQLLYPDAIPQVILSNTEKNIVKSNLEKLNLIPHSDKKIVKTQLRIILLELFTKYLIREKTPDRHLPSWLEDTLNEMEKKENFQEGISALIRLSQKSHEHLCRILKKNMNISPTQLVNDLRLNYSANLLIHSDMEIIDVCFDSGFENLSYFYHIFKKKYNYTPSKFRKQHQHPQLFTKNL